MPVIFREVLESDLNAVVTVHKQCFKGYFSSLLSDALLLEFYREYYKENKSLFIVADNDGTIVGFVMGYVTGSTARTSFERKHRWALGVRLLTLCLIFNREALIRVRRRIHHLFKKLKPKNTLSHDPKEATLLSICMLPEFQGGGRAAQMVTLFEEALAKQDKHIYVLSVKNTNTRGIRFYEKLGFTVQRKNDTDTTFIKTI